MDRPLVGVCAIIRKKNEVLLGLRKNGHAGGFWGFPGGHMEGGEFFEQCAIRGTEEETGIILPSARFWTVENTIYHVENKHYIVIFMVADLPIGQMFDYREPEKCELLGWFRWDRLPTPLMHGIVKLASRGLAPFGAGR